jgi:hypothetical protein
MIKARSEREWNIRAWRGYSYAFEDWGSCVRLDGLYAEVVDPGDERVQTVWAVESIRSLRFDGSFLVSH